MHILGFGLFKHPTLCRNKVLIEIPDLLGPYDDLESLAYSLLYLLIHGASFELTKTAMKRTLVAKTALTIPVPFEFHDLLNLARKAKGDITENPSKVDETNKKPKQSKSTFEDAVPTGTPELMESRASSDSESDVGPDEGGILR